MPCLQVLTLYPQDGSGAISSQELLGVMRAMGQNPTEDEVTQYGLSFGLTKAMTKMLYFIVQFC